MNDELVEQVARAMIAARKGEHSAKSVARAIIPLVLEAAAQVAEDAAHGDKRMEEHYLKSARLEVSTAGRAVDIETAVSFAKRALGARAIAHAIRQLTGVSDAI